MLNECVDFASEAREMVLEIQLVHIDYALIEETGQYPEDCR